MKSTSRYPSSSLARDHYSRHPVRSRSKTSKYGHRALVCPGLLSASRIEQRGSCTWDTRALWVGVAMTTTTVLLIICSSTVSDSPTAVTMEGTYCLSISRCSISFLDNIGGPTHQPQSTRAPTSLLVVVDLRFLTSLRYWYRMINRWIYRSASVLDLDDEGQREERQLTHPMK